MKWSGLGDLMMLADWGHVCEELSMRVEVNEFVTGSDSLPNDQKCPCGSLYRE